MGNAGFAAAPGGGAAGGRATKSATPSTSQRGASGAVSARAARWNNSWVNTIRSASSRIADAPGAKTMRWPLALRWSRST